jgi:hypothetical protein
MDFILKKHLDSSEDNTLIFTEIFLAGCKYTELAFAHDQEKVDTIKKSCMELMDKLAKTALGKDKFHSVLKETEDELNREAESGICVIGTHNLASAMEDFLFQAVGVLDVFANQFLRATVGFGGKWHHEKIIKHFRSIKTLDKETVDEIERTLDEDWKDWLDDMIQDRNVHHEKNFELSEMHLINNKPVVVLTRRNGVKINDIAGYIDTHWENLFGLIKDMIYLTFCSICPVISSMKLDKQYFLSKEKS